MSKVTVVSIKKRHHCQLNAITNWQTFKQLYAKMNFWKIILKISVDAVKEKACLESSVISLRHKTTYLEMQTRYFENVTVICLMQKLNWHLLHAATELTSAACSNRIVICLMAATEMPYAWWQKQKCHMLDDRRKFCHLLQVEKWLFEPLAYSHI